MKIEISIDGDSRGSELKCASDFLFALANEHNAAEGIPAFYRPVLEHGVKYNDLETGRVVNTGKPAAVEPVVTEKVIDFADAMAKAEIAGGENTQQSKIEALADKVAEATQVKEESEEYTVEAVISMTEDEMKNVPTPVLIEALETFGIDPTTRPGKNTNAKLRGLLISAIAEAEKEEEAAEETEKAEAIKPQEEPEEKAPEEEAPEEEEITIEMLRNVARELIAANKRKVIAEAFEACGCSNFSTLKKQDYNNFYDLCKK
jgi:hypothetical protein